MRYTACIKHHILLLIALPLVIFAHSLSGDFLAYDDELLILDNPTVHGLTVENMKTAFTSYDPELYIPLTLLTHQIEWSLFGDNPLPYKAINLLLHIVSTLCIYGAFSILFTRRIALLLAAIFAIHPLNVEAVAWASGRKDVLAACFCFASLLAYLRAREAGASLKKSVTLFLCGLLSKVSIAPLPIALLAIEWYRTGKLTKADVRRVLPYILLAVLFIVIALCGKKVESLDLLSVITLSFASVSFYLGKFFVPTGLGIFYPFNDPITFFHPRILWGALVVLSVVFLVWHMRKSRPQLLAGCMIFYAFVGPSFFNALKGGEGHGADVYFASDRYVYIGMIGFLLILGTFLHRKKVYQATAVVTAIFAVLCYLQSTTWLSNTRLFQNVIDNGRDAHVAYLNLGAFTWQAGNEQRGLELITRSVEIRPTSRGLFNLGQIMEREKQYEQAVALYKAALEIAPHNEKIQQRLHQLASKSF